MSVNFDELAGSTEGVSGAQIEGICQKAAYRALRKYIDINKKSI